MHWNENKSKAYCCFGCKVVDELLHNNQRIPYAQNIDSEAFSYLDEDSISEKLLDFKEGGFARIRLHLPAIHCSSCIYLLESLPDIEKAITGVQIHFGKKQAQITFRHEELKLSNLAALLNYIGYTPDFQTQLNTGKEKKNKLLIQLGVAGFFFGNTMLLALPEYFGTDLSTNAELQTFFRYLMLAFSIPVLVFSARDYFINAWKSLRAGILSIDLPIALGLTVLFLRSIYEVFSATGAGFFDSLCGLVFFLLLGKWYQQKTYRNFTFDRDFRSFIPLSANLILKDGREKPIAVDQLEAGDCIRVRHGEVICADGLLQNEMASLDYSYLSGESLPIQKYQDELLYAGARNTGGLLELSVTKSVDRSYLSSLWNNQSFHNTKHKQTIGSTDKVARYFTPIIIILAIGSAIFWAQTDMAKAINVFTAVLIVACPCALALAEPFANGSLMRLFGAEGLFFKNAAVLNQMARITHIVFDKTGTLTEQRNMQVSWHGNALSISDKQAISIIADQSTHPLAQRLASSLGTVEYDKLETGNFKEHLGKGVEAMVANDQYSLGSAAFTGASNAHEDQSVVYIKRNDVILGYYSFQLQERPWVTKVLSKLKSYFRLSLLSGDNQREAVHFQKTFGTDAELRFNQSPQQKLDYIKEQQKQGAKLMMLGDGLNDAGALQQSDVGVSICEEHVNFFPASDALLMAKAFPKLPDFMLLSQQNKRIIYAAFVLSFAYNIGGIAFAIAGLLSPLVSAILMPLSSISVVLFTTLANRYFVKKRLSA